jgi:adenylate kinase
MGKKLEAAFNISVPDDILIQRMSGRVSCENCKSVYNTRFNPPAKEGICDKCGGKLIQRDDDKEETVKNRLNVYMDQTKPLIEYYSQHGILHTIDGNRATAEVFDEIKGFLGSL